QQEDHRVGGFSAAEAVLLGVMRRGQGVFQEAFQGDFAEGAAGLGATENVFERASGLKHLLAGLLDFAELVLDLIDLLAGIFKLQGHRGLGFRGDFRGDLGGVFHAVFKGGGDGFEAGGDGAGDGFELGGALRLGGGEIQQVAAHLVHLGFEGFVLLLALSVLGQESNDQAEKQQAENHGGNDDGIHGFTPVRTGNGNSHFSGKRGVEQGGEAEGKANSRQPTVGREERWYDQWRVPPCFWLRDVGKGVSGQEKGESRQPTANSEENWSDHAWGIPPAFWRFIKGKELWAGDLEMCERKGVGREVISL